jgi:hypothetical protein
LFCFVVFVCFLSFLSLPNSHVALLSLSIVLVISHPSLPFPWFCLFLIVLAEGCVNAVWILCVS